MREIQQSALKGKAQEVEHELAQWAEAEKVLLPGQVIVCTLSIQERRMVEVVTGETLSFAQEELPLAGERRPHQGPVHLKPARLSPEGVEEILGPFKGVLRDFMWDILVKNSNNPTRKRAYYSTYQTQVNSKLRSVPLAGKTYRVAGHQGYLQLWEIDPASATKAT